MAHKVYHLALRLSGVLDGQLSKLGSLFPASMAKGFFLDCLADF